MTKKRRMKMRIKTMVWNLSLALIAGAVYGRADVISFNIYDPNNVSNTQITSNPDRFSGVEVDSDGWEEFAINTSGTHSYTNVDGTAMDVDIVSANSGNSATYHVNSCAFKYGVGTGSSITLKDVPYEYYSVAVYVGGYSSSTNAQVSDGETTYYYSFSPVYTETALHLSEDTNIADGSDGGNYVMFGSLTNPVSGDVTITVYRENDDDGAAFIGGIQVMELPADSVTVPPEPVYSFNIYDSGNVSNTQITDNTNRFHGVVLDTDGWEEVAINSFGSHSYTNVDGGTMDVDIISSNNGNSATYHVNSCAFKYGVGTGSSITLTDVPYDYYYVAVYVGGYNTSTNGQVSDGETTYYYSFSSVYTETALHLSEDTNIADGADGGNYVIFGGVTDPISGDVTITVSRENDEDGAAFIGGFQVIQIPESSIDFTPNPAFLNIFYNGTNVVVSSQDLTATASNVLQVTTSLNSPAWSNVPPASTGTSIFSWEVSPSDKGCFRVISY
jgi:hypothetical protein